jgi:hypothetical protein
MKISLRVGFLFCVTCNLFLAKATPANLALAGTATQSSNFGGWLASNAIDGNTDGNIGDGSVTHTQSELPAWWRVDLGNTYLLDSIELWNRTDCCGDRLSNFHVSVLNSGQVEIWGQDYFTSSGFPNPNLLIALPSNTNGQFVMVQLNTQNYLSLAEVIVIGDQAGVPEPASTAFVMGGIAVLIALRHRDKRRLANKRSVYRP